MKKTCDAREMAEAITVISSYAIEKSRSNGSSAISPITYDIPPSRTQTPEGKGSYLSVILETPLKP